MTARERAIKYWYTVFVASVILVCFGLHGLASLRESVAPHKLLASFWISGRAAAQHMDPYGFYPGVPRILAHRAGSTPVLHDVNLNPPCMLPLFEWLSRFPVARWATWWTAVQVLLFIGAAAMAWFGGARQARKVWWLLVSSFTYMDLTVGEDYALFVFLSFAVWLLLKNGHRTAAYVTAGVLIALKPNLGLWLVLLAAGGYWRNALTAGLTAGAVSAVPVLRYGWRVYAEWFRASALVPHWISATDISLMGIATRMGSRQAGVLLAGVAAGALVTIATRRRPAEASIAGMAVCAGVLCSPLGWYHYAMLAAPFFAMEKDWDGFQTWAAFLVWLPPLFQTELILRGRAWVFLLSIPHLLGLLMMLGWFLRDGVRERAVEREELVVASC
jgi:hypothetical protein